MGILILTIIVIVGAFSLFAAYSNKKAIDASIKARAERIYQKYGHSDIAEKIINKTVWVGQTSDQLLDSLGNPIDIDENVLKTKKKEIWKYLQKSANRYGFKVKVENNIVVGWDEKV